jgi:aryl-alcohol dehydrogenase-like predicted oxidoreductase
MEQPQYNLMHRERVEVEYKPLYAEYGMGTTIWSPLASGLLSGKYNNGVPPDSRLAQAGFEWLRDSLLGEGLDKRIGKVRALKTIADDLGVSQVQLALVWCLLNPHVSTVMLGASRLEQLEHNLGAMDVLPRLEPATAKPAAGSRVTAAVGARTGRASEYPEESATSLMIMILI